MEQQPERTLVEKVKDFLKRRSQDYRIVFGTPVGERVLADLAKFCRAHESTFHMDPRMHAVLEGRREVFLRIANHMKLTSDELYNLYNGRKES